MEIKIGLKNLYAGFQESASNEDLSAAERRLAARMCVVVAHISRIEGLIRSVDKHVMAVLDARLAKFMEELGAELAGVTQGDVPAAESPAEPPVEGESPAGAKPPVQTTPPAPMPPRKGPKPTPPKVEQEQDEETELTVANILADTEAELRAIEAQTQTKPALRTVPAPTGGNAS